jgi:outer membrane protein TolC
VKEAAAQTRKAQQDYEKVALQVIKEVETAFLALQAAERNIKTAETALVSAEEDYRIAQLRYTEGRGINVEVLDALTAFTRARTNHVQALYDYNVARDQLTRAIGQP